MNKLKKAISTFRDYLGRDKEGLRRLNEIANIANDIRKQKAAMEHDLDIAKQQLAAVRKERDDAKSQTQKAEEDMEAERARRHAASSREQRLVVRFAEYRKKMEPDSTEMDALEQSALNDIPKYRRFFKEVRRRFPKGPPKIDDKAVVQLESVVQTYSIDEFTSLGMLLAAMAMSNFPAYLKSNTLFTAAREREDGWTESDSEKFVRWYKTWIRTSPAEERIRGPSDMTTMEHTPFGLQTVPNKTIRRSS